MPTVLEQLSSSLADRYRLEREIGAGGMATVYLAHDLKHDRPVALKVLHPELSAVLGADRFLTEIKTTAALQHPHILPLFDSGSAHGLLFYVMPLIDGETLRQRLEREKQLPVGDAVRISKEVASALDYAHRRGVIHRDIKPENILLHDGSALVADFGIALAVQSAGGARITQTGLSLGTPQYMSPEQAMGERDITARSDVYSLGAVAYEMLVGQAPFTGPTAQSIVAKVMTEDPAPITRTRKTVPLGVESAIITALQKLPADRFGTTAEFAAALEMDSGARPATAASSIGRQPAGKRARPLLAVGAIALLAIGMAAGKTLIRESANGIAMFKPRTFRDQAIFMARAAPDGQTIVFSAANEGTRTELYLVRPDYPEARPLGLKQAHLLSISSKGELAVIVRANYLGFRLFTGTLARVPLGGGAPREMMDGIREADWSPDGSQLVAIHDVDGEDRLEYPIGNVVHKTTGYLSDPRMSPDGSKIAFLAHPWRYDDRGIAIVVDLKGKALVKTREFAALQGMAWLPGGNEIAFSGDVEGQGLVVHVVNMKGDVRMPVSAPGDIVVHDITADGRWIISSDQRSVSVLARGPGDKVAREQGWLDYSFRPFISRDGKLLTFGDASSGSTNLYSTILRQTAGGEATQLGDGYPVGFSPDGQWIASVIPTTPAKLVLYPTGVGTERAVPTGSLDQVTSVDWFRDGKTMLVCGNAKGKAAYCGTIPVAGGEPKPVTAGGTSDGRISPDGRAVMVSNGPLKYTVYELGSSAPPVPVPLDSGERVVGWSNTGRGVVVRMPLSITAVRLDLATGKRQVIMDDPVVDLTAVNAISNLNLADDPHVYAYVARRQKSRLYTVEGVK
ncbi:MAG: protein kinase [Gemmatimonadaceae bacterium]|nr:protein kinase [Gemmatimonadaceae bacterium]